MSALALLQDLEGWGVTLEVRGPKLIVEGPVHVLSDEVVDELRTMKPELIALVARRPSPEWDAADWQAYFDERAAIREHDGRLTQAEAERLAFEDALTHWLCLHPAPATDPRRGCVHCESGEYMGNKLLPVLALDGHVWVHDRCWSAWHAERLQSASEALRRAGLPQPKVRCRSPRPVEQEPL